MAIDWIAVETDYINGNYTRGQLAEKWGISPSLIGTKCAAGHWVAKRDVQRKKIKKRTSEKTAETIATSNAEIANILNACKLKIVKRLSKRLDDDSQTNNDFKKLTDIYAIISNTIETETDTGALDDILDALKGGKYG